MKMNREVVRNLIEDQVYEINLELYCREYCGDICELVGVQLDTDGHPSVSASSGILIGKIRRTAMENDFRWLDEDYTVNIDNYLNKGDLEAIADYCSDEEITDPNERFDVIDDFLYACSDKYKYDVYAKQNAFDREHGVHNYLVENALKVLEDEFGVEWE